MKSRSRAKSILKAAVLALAINVCLGAHGADSALQSSIDSVAALPGGGIVRLPAGTYVTGSIELKKCSANCRPGGSSCATLTALSSIMCALAQPLPTTAR